MLNDRIPIASFAHTSSGGTPSREHPEYYTGDILWVTTGELNDCYIEDTNEKITREAIAHSSAKIFPANTLLMAMYGATIGKLGVLKKEAATNQACCAIFPNDTVNPEFLYYCLLNDRKQIIEKGCGAGQPNISQAVVKELTIPKFNIKEQEAIASALSDVDELISSLEKLIEKKKNIKHGVMQELLTGKRRLPGFTGEWTEYEIGKVGIFYSGLSGKTKEDFGHGSAKFIPFMNVLYNTVINADYLESVVVGEHENQNRVQKGDLFFNTSSETPEEVGMCCVLNDELSNTYLNSFCFGFRIADQQQYMPLYLSYFFNSPYGREKMLFLAQGSTRYNLSKTNFAKLKIAIPTQNEQKAIVSILFDMDIEIETLEKRLEKYRQLKQGMMQKLLTGEIRLI